MVIVQVLDSLCNSTFASALFFLSDLDDFLQIPTIALGVFLMDKVGQQPLLLVRRLRHLYCVMELMKISLNPTIFPGFYSMNMLRLLACGIVILLAGLFLRKIYLNLVSSIYWIFLKRIELQLRRIFNHGPRPRQF